MVASVRCPYCHGAIHAGDKRCASCGAGAPMPPTAVERAVGVAVPRLNFNATVLASLVVTVALGAVASTAGGLFALLAFFWLVPGMPVLLILTAIRDARALGKSVIPGVVVSFVVWFAGFIMFMIALALSSI
jgi:hypothetical protein